MSNKNIFIKPKSFWSRYGRAIGVGIFTFYFAKGLIWLAIFFGVAFFFPF